MAVIQRRSTTTKTIPPLVVLAVVLIIAAIVIAILCRKRRGPIRRSPDPAVNRFPDRPASRLTSWLKSMLPKPPEAPRFSRPSREIPYPSMRSELQNNPHRNHGRPVPLTASSNGPVRGSATQGSTRTMQPLPGTSSMVTMFKVPSSDPVRPLPPTPSKTPPVRKAIPVRNNDVSHLPQNAYSIPSSTATAVGTRTASNTPPPSRQQPHSANRPPTSASTLRDTTSSSTLRNATSSSTVQAPVSTYNSQSRTLRSPLSDRNIQLPAQAHEDHPALRQPVSSPSLPSKQTNDPPSAMLQPLPFPLTSDTTDLSTELANPQEQAHLGYKNVISTTSTRQGSGDQINTQTSSTTTTPTHAQSQQSNTKPSSSSRPHVNSTYANYLSTRLQTPTSSSSLLSPSSLAALLVGSEAGTTDAGSGYDEAGKPTYRRSIEGGAGGLTTTAGTPTNPIDSTHRGRVRERSGEIEVQERYTRFREKGNFTADDDPVGRPWGRFDSNIERERELERERDGERGDDGGSGEGGGGGVMPLRLPIKNPDPSRVVRGAGAG